MNACLRESLVRGIAQLGRGMNIETVAECVETAAVRDLKAGKVEFRVDKTGIIHCPVGKKSFEDAKLEENLHALIDAVVKAKPSAAKGKYLKSAYLSTTMSPSVKLDVSGY